MRCRSRLCYHSHCHCDSFLVCSCATHVFLSSFIFIFFSLRFFSSWRYILLHFLFSGSHTSFLSALHKAHLLAKSLVSSFRNTFIHLIRMFSSFFFFIIIFIRRCLVIVREYVRRGKMPCKIGSIDFVADWWQTICTDGYGRWETPVQLFCTERVERIEKFLRGRYTCPVWTHVMDEKKTKSVFFHFCLAFQVGK